MSIGNERPEGLPLTRKAVVQVKGGMEIQDIALPPVEPFNIAVKTVAVALNPTDYKTAQNFPSPGATVGCDFAGTVVHIGKEAAKRPQPWKIGDRVCGPIHGSNPIDHAGGAFAEYVQTPADLVMRIPESISWEDGAAIGGTGHGSLCLGLWEYLQVPGRPDNPAKEPEYVLVYGGSTATGTMAIQLLKLSGLIPITTCSPHNLDLVKSYGAAAVFDYTSPTCASDVRAYTKNALFYALDCITDEQSVEICYAAIGRAGGRYASLEYCPPHLQTRQAISSDFVFGYEMFGKRVALGGAYEREAKAELRDAAVRWFGVMHPLWEKGEVRAHPVKTLPGSWKGVLNGLDILRKGGVSGHKLVVRVD